MDQSFSSFLFRRASTQPNTPWNSHTLPARLVFVLLLLAFAPCLAPAQLRVAPYLAGSLGISDIRTRISVQTSPPSSDFATTHAANALAAINIGLEFGGHLAADAGLRSHLLIGHPFRAVTVGPVARLGSLFFRGGLGRVQGFEAVACGGTASCSSYDSEWTTGFEVSAGMDFRTRSDWTVGPVLWWAQSTNSATQYRSIGLGAFVRFR